MQFEKSTARPVRRRRDASRALHRALDLLEPACNAMPEGFAICRAVRDLSGQAVDFRVERANAALQRMLGGDSALAGQGLRQALRTTPGDFVGVALAVFRDGRPQVIESGGAGKTYKIRFDAAGPERLTVLVTDRTAFELEEHRHAERLMELNHRTKNNLASVAGLLRLQAARTDDPAVREQLIKAANRVDAVSEAHASLYRFGSGEVVDLGAYLEELCERLGRGLVDNGRVSLDVEAAAVLGPFEDVLPLGIVVNELVTNAAKYAYPEPMSGAIHVRLGRIPDGISLTVSDDGCGLPACPSPKSSGLGMQLVRSLVRQLDGSFDIHRRHPGSAFEIRLPRPRMRGDGSQDLSV